MCEKAALSSDREGTDQRRHLLHDEESKGHADAIAYTGWLSHLHVSVSVEHR
jgi:hypothetical protein